MFEAVYLVDDFTGLGTSFIRCKKDGSWTGKVKKFWDALANARQRIEKSGQYFPLTTKFPLHIHHYISSAQACLAIAERLKAIRAQRQGTGNWFAEVDVTEGLHLPLGTKLDSQDDPDMWKICETYYDHDLFEQLREHLEEAGQTHIRHGYGNAALPVVLEHNCPNNAITLLWAETEGVDGVKDRHAMRPLFPRRHRHS